jgi:hypothetical protein
MGRTKCITRFNIKNIIHSAHRLYLWVSYDFQNEQKLLPYAELTN